MVEVEVTDGSTNASAQTPVKFFASQLATDANSPQGLPTYRILAEHGKPWRSRYDQQQNEIVINSAHRDFAASRTPLAKHRRYIGKLYAKEVVLINFPHESLRGRHGTADRIDVANGGESVSYRPLPSPDQLGCDPNPRLRGFPPATSTMKI